MPATVALACVDTEDDPCVGLAGPPGSRRARRPTHNCPPAHVASSMPAPEPPPPRSDDCPSVPTASPAASFAERGTSLLVASGAASPVDVMVRDVFEPAIE